MANNQKSLLALMLIAVAVAVYTQFPNVDKASIEYLNYGAWLLLIGAIIIAKRMIYASWCMKALVLIVLGGYIMDTLLMFFGVISSMSGYVTLTIIPIIVYYSAYYISSYESRDLIAKSLTTVFCIMTLLMAMQIASKFITNYAEWKSAETYLYDGSTHKNSTAQVLGSGFIIIMVGFTADKHWKTILKIVCLGIIIVALLYVQSRAALMGVVIAVSISVLLQKNVKRAALWLGGGLLFIYSNTLLGWLRQAFFINKYSTGGALDLDRFSSGRLYYWKLCWNYFLQSPIWGKGYTYCDNFYINALASGGLLLGGLLIGVYAARVIVNIKRFKREQEMGNHSKICQITATLSLFFVIISIFEGFPPYGPGVASMALWLFSGYSDGRERFLES